MHEKVESTIQEKDENERSLYANSGRQENSMLQLQISSSSPHSFFIFFFSFFLLGDNDQYYNFELYVLALSNVHI